MAAHTACCSPAQGHVLLGQGAATFLWPATSQTPPPR